MPSQTMPQCDASPRLTLVPQGARPTFSAYTEVPWMDCPGRQNARQHHDGDCSQVSGQDPLATMAMSSPKSSSYQVQQ